MLITGFGMLLHPLRVLADVVPPVGAVVGMGLGLISTLLGVVLGGLIIAIAWLAVRPLLSVGILAVAAGIAFLLWRTGRLRLKRKAATAAAQAGAVSAS